MRGLDDPGSATREGRGITSSFLNVWSSEDSWTFVRDIHEMSRTVKDIVVEFSQPLMECECADERLYKTVSQLDLFVRMAGIRGNESCLDHHVGDERCRWQSPVLDTVSGQIGRRHSGAMHDSFGEIQKP